jgi:hypothetical protein
VITDRNGNELKIGDEVVIRGRVVGAPVEAIDGTVLQVEWRSDAPVTDYVKSTSVEKAQ